MMPEYDRIRARIAEAMDRLTITMARHELLQAGIADPAAVEKLTNAPMIQEAKERKIEALTLSCFAEAGIRPVMQ